MTGLLNNIVGNRTSEKDETIQRGSDVCEVGSFKPSRIVPEGKSFQVRRLEIQIVTSWSAAANTIHGRNLGTGSTDSHSDCGQSLGCEIAVVGVSKSFHGSCQIGLTGAKTTSTNTTILIEKHVHGTIGQSDKHFWDVTNRTTKSWVIEVVLGTKGIDLTRRAVIERSTSGGWSFVALDGGRGRSTISLTGSVGKRRAQGGAVGEPIGHTSIDVGDVSSDVEVDSSQVIKIRHSDVDIVWTNDQLVEKGLDEILESNHGSVTNGRRVIDVDPNIHLGVTDATSWLSDCLWGTDEGGTIEDEDTSIAESHFTDFTIS